MIGGKYYQESAADEMRNPARSVDNIGMCWNAHEGMVKKAMRVAAEAFPAWRDSPARRRAHILETFATALEAHRSEMVALLVREAGKTLPDALGEVREAVDFCRYYAQQGRAIFTRAGQAMPGVTGESNILRMRGRGVFVCISPWNFPLAIFTGQIVAALMAGNTVSSITVRI